MKRFCHLVKRYMKFLTAVHCQKSAVNSLSPTSESPLCLTNQQTSSRSAVHCPVLLTFVFCLRDLELLNEIHVFFKTT